MTKRPEVKNVLGLGIQLRILGGEGQAPVGSLMDPGLAVFYTLPALFLQELMSPGWSTDPFLLCL